MVFDGIILSILVGFLRKGNLKGLASVKFRSGWIFPLLLTIQILIFSLQNKVEILGQLSGYVYIIVYIIGLTFLFLNREHKGFWLIFIGVFLNFVVIAVNDGRMPVSLEAAALLEPGYLDPLKEGLYAKHAFLTESTKLGLLGDIIPLTNPYPRSQIISIGDILMNIGIFIFIQQIMLQKSREESDTNLTFVKGGETNE